MARLKLTYYQPGLITLALLPIMYCIHLGYKCVDKKRVYAIQFNMPRKQSEKLYGKFPPDRKYEEVTLTGNQPADSIKIQQLENRIKSFAAKRDSINGICIHYGNSINYQTFITLIDICNVDSISIFGIADDSDFYIAPYAERREIYMPPAQCGNTCVHPRY